MKKSYAKRILPFSWYRRRLSRGHLLCLLLGFASLLVVACGRSQEAAPMDKITSSVTNLVSLTLDAGTQELIDAAQKEQDRIVADLNRQREVVEQRLNRLQTNKSSAQK